MHVMIRFKSRPMAAFLALVAGFLGAHRWYLGQPMAWVYLLLSVAGLAWGALGPGPFLVSTGTHLAALVWVVALFESIHMALRPDAVWDARWNPQQLGRSRNGAVPVLIAILALMLAATVLMSVFAIAFESYFAARLSARSR